METEGIVKVVAAPLAEAKPTTEAKESTSAGELVEKAFNEAVCVTVKNDESVQTEIMHSAEQVIRNKTQELKARAETEAKEAHFNNKKSACECFGYNEATTEKWAVSLMGFWHSVLTAFWIVLGMFTFAPITFVAKKLSVIIKTAWLAVLIAIVIYIAIALSPLWIGFVQELRPTIFGGT